MPYRGVVCGEAADTGREEIHVQEGDLGPGVEGWFEVEF